MLRYFRKMGSMEQIFTMFNDDKIAGWGPMAAVNKINGLSQIPLKTLQMYWNKIHLKYESFQCQILTTPNVNEYDDVFIGCLPFQITKCDAQSQEDRHQLLVHELNHRFLLLNDFNFSHKDIQNKNYNISDIAPLYRIFIVDDWLLINTNHCLLDHISYIAMLTDFLSLLNNDTFNDTKITYSTIEQCIKPNLSSSKMERKINNLIPTRWALKFGKFYANNYYLSKYNPLNLHRDDILRFQYYFDPKLLAFPLKTFDKTDYRVNYKTFILSKAAGFGLRKQCKLNKVHMSSLLQYVATAAMIECHDSLQGNYYKTMVNNVFSTIPMYKDPKKTYLGIHASAYCTVIEYYKNVGIGSDRFWQIIRKIDEQVLNENMLSKVYKNKFPYMNLKKFMRFVLNDKSDIFEGRGMGAPTITNPGLIRINKKDWKYCISETYGGANPGVGMGAMYLLGGTTIKGIDKMRMGMIYGVQHLTQQMAQDFMDTLQAKLQLIGSLPSNTNYSSKL